MTFEDTKDIKILYVEDDDITRENAVEYLENFFEDIYEASNALDAYKLYEKYHPDIVITDIQMPKFNGLDFVSKIREKDNVTRVIITSAFTSKEYLFKAIELQLVAYLIKPIKELELQTALEKCVQSLKKNRSNIINIAQNVCFDSFNQILIINDEIVQLRTKELLLLELLVKTPNRFISYESIESYVWQDMPMSKDALKTVIKNIKVKLPKDCIKNLSGTGYKIELL